ncbi:probable xyloglucan endotransglucosylase/hydrolase protein 10 [Mangifera indica]|uniref:probable xyloglucan endotransglucosylase/hydrolase protein 10 n=1 Tax=Mangifera indica TaxID=29780 RepID=UPI001CFAED0C|nr:probable xyloglucan endotransglucosylase/hydrolase protein 10 [Mangifera indica]
MLSYFKFVAFIWFLNRCAIQFSTASVVSTGDFNKDFFVSWSPSHVNTSADGKLRSLKLDNESGAAFASNQMFLFGQIDMEIKLVPGDSAGTVLAFYLASDQPNRDELDIEFLGNVTGQPYILQTNVFADGFDDREERIYLWFDPTVDFHNYSVLWNLHQIVFMVDFIPIRTYRNHADKGVAYPRWQPMSIKASLWNGDSWATRGGRDKTDWSKAPFIASFRSYKIDACVWNGNPRFCRADSSESWWNKERYSSLDRDQKRWLKWVRKYHMIYDYCQDNQRFQNNLPKECSLPKY